MPAGKYFATGKYRCIYIYIYILFFFLYRSAGKYKLQTELAFIE